MSGKARARLSFATSRRWWPCSSLVAAAPNAALTVTGKNVKDGSLSGKDVKTTR